MDVINLTPFPMAPLAARLTFPGHTLSLIVKGTFELQAGGPLQASEEQQYTAGDVFHDDDEEETGSLRYDADSACVKPQADVMLVGSCHAPGGVPVTEAVVSVRVGALSRSLAVFGDRSWVRGALGRRTMSDTTPFTTMDLRYERSYGGQKNPFNPVGCGAGTITDNGQKSWPLPNIEDPANPITRPGDKPAPVGFGPIDRMWKDRRDKLGTYKGDYTKTRWPWFPVDFDPAFFNSAPADMQIAGFLRGDESLTLQNLVKDQPLLEASLPGLRLRCFLQDIDPSNPGAAPRFREVDMKCDTLWMDTDALKAVLIWRGHVPVLDEEFEEVTHAFVVAEPLDQNPRSPEEWRAEFNQIVAGLAVPPEEEPEPEPEAEQPEAEEVVAGGEGSDGDGDDDDDDDVEAEVARLRAQLGSEEEEDIFADIDPDAPPPPMTKDEREIAVETLRQLNVDPAVIATFEEEARLLAGERDEELWTRETVIEHAARGESFAEKDLRGLDLSGLDLSGVDFQETDLRSVNFSESTLIGTRFNDSRLDDCNFEKADLTGAMARDASLTGSTLEDATLEEADFSRSMLDRLDLRRARLIRTTFAGASMREVNLAGAQTEEIDLTEANLVKAMLQNSSLCGAQLADATLNEARMAGINLEQADVTGARLDDAHLTRAVLSEAVFDQASLRRVRLGDAVAVKTSFQEAVLDEAGLERINAEGARFDGASLERARFTDATLIEASLRMASGPHADFSRSDMTSMRGGPGMVFPNASFRQITAPDSIWQKATLDDADFSYARMRDADFTKASMNRVNLEAADVRFGKFTKAKLLDASLVRMDLFEGSAKGADLTGADLTGSNFYGADFFEAVTERTRGEDVNIRMTLLERG